MPRVLQQQIRELIDQIDGMKTGGAEAIHQARVASRRLREVLPVAAGAAPTLLPSGTRRQVRRLTAAMGRAREMDVAIETFARACAEQAWTPTIIRRVQRHLESERRHARRFMQEGLRQVDLPKLESSVSGLAEALANRTTPGWQRPLAARLRARALRFDRAIVAVGTLYAPEALHEVRIAAKKLRYALELAHGSSGVGVAREIRSLKGLQDLLGRLHDLQVLQGQIAAMSTGAGDLKASRVLDEMAQIFDVECRALHARFLARRERMPAVIARIRDHIAPAVHSAPPCGRMLSMQVKPASVRPVRVKARAS